MKAISALTTEQKALVFDRLLALKEDEVVQAVVLSVACDVAAEARAFLTEGQKNSVPEEVDIFDFASFGREHEAFAVHYSELELTLRLAIFLDYRYNHLAPENRDLVRVQKSKKTGKTLLVSGKAGKVLKKDWFDDMTEAFEPRRLLEKWYAHFAPEKENSKIVIKNALRKYHGYEDFIFNKLYKQYVDEDWMMAPSWFTAKWRYRSDGSRERMADYYARKA